MIRSVLVACLPAIIFIHTNAQELVTDRPDQTESSSVVPTGYLQWESGFGLEGDVNVIKTITMNLNSSLFRYGIRDRIELRLGTELVKVQDYIEYSGIWELREVNTFLSSVYAGGKIQLSEQVEFIPEMAILGHISFPKPFGQAADGEYIAPDLTFAASYTFNDQLSTGINLGSHWPGFGKGRPDIFYSIVMGLKHTEKITSFYEIYGYNPAHTLSKDVRIDLGVTFLVQPNFQLDLSSGKGMSEISPDFFIAGGFSWRIPD